MISKTYYGWPVDDDLRAAVAAVVPPDGTPVLRVQRGDRGELVTVEVLGWIEERERLVPPREAP